MDYDLWIDMLETIYEELFDLSSVRIPQCTMRLYLGIRRYKDLKSKDCHLNTAMVWDSERFRAHIL